MCGITGFIGLSADQSLEQVVRSMTGSLLHRGPDDEGVWVDGSCRIAFGHRRLSVLDLSSSGHQPMHSASSRYVVVFNGEIYNHLELRRQLELEGDTSHDWKGHSDTETLLACFEAWGIEKTLKRTVGMFAIAVWDRQERLLFLARDRMGEKPLGLNSVKLTGGEPMLDHRVVELAWQLPLGMKIRNGRGKWALRQILYKYVPKEMIERPKAGFAIPLGQWLRGPLREWAEDMLAPERLSEQGYRRQEPVQQKWKEHLTGKRNWEHCLWSVLMFQAWLETQQRNS